jgi:heme exporter protein D
MLMWLRISSSLRMHSLPRSLPSTSSASIPHPLLIGCLIGVFGTLFVQGFIFIVYRVCRRHHQFKSIRKRSGLFGSSEARHIEQFTMSACTFPVIFVWFAFHLTQLSLTSIATSSLNGKTSLLRVAHRNLDGSWSFTDTDRQSTQQTVSSPVLSPSNSMASAPWSPDASTATSSSASPTHSRPLPTPPWSPVTSTSSSTFNPKAPPPSAFPPALAQRSSRMDVVDCGSSARTGPPPYNTTPSPVPPIPREFLNIKGGHLRR